MSPQTVWVSILSCMALLRVDGASCMANLSPNFNLNRVRSVTIFRDLPGTRMHSNGRLERTSVFLSL